MTPSRLVPSRPRGIRLLPALGIVALLVVACGRPIPRLPAAVAERRPADPNRPSDADTLAVADPQPIAALHERARSDPRGAHPRPPRAGATLVKPPPGDFAMTPRTSGRRVRRGLRPALSPASRRLVGAARATTLYVMRVDGTPPTTEDLEAYPSPPPARYVGIAGSTRGTRRSPRWAGPTSTGSPRGPTPRPAHRHDDLRLGRRRRLPPHRRRRHDQPRPARRPARRGAAEPDATPSRSQAPPDTSGAASHR